VPPIYKNGGKTMAFMLKIRWDINNDKVAHFKSDQ